MDILVVKQFFEHNLLGKFLYKFLCGNTLSFLLVELLDQKVDTYLMVKNSISQSSCAILHSHQQCMRVLVAACPPHQQSSEIAAILSNV